MVQRYVPLFTLQGHREGDPMKTCSHRDCQDVATFYAMDTCAGGWGDYYCSIHIPPAWIVERL